MKPITYLSVLILFLSTCQNKDSISTNNLIEGAYGNLKNRDLISAKEKLFKAKEINPKDNEVLCLEAFISIVHDKNRLKAQSLINEVLRNDKTYGRAYFIQGQIDNYNQKSPCESFHKALEYGYEVPKELLFFHSCN